LGKGAMFEVLCTREAYIMHAACGVNDKTNLPL
jgi:hypothetical protein